MGDDGEDCLVVIFSGGGSPLVKTSCVFSDSLGLSLNTDCSLIGDVLPISSDGSLVGDDGEGCLVGLFGGFGSFVVKTSHFIQNSLGLSLNIDCLPLGVVLPISGDFSLVGDDGKD